MNTSAVGALLRSLPQLRRCTLLASGMWILTEILLGLLRGEMAVVTTIGGLRWIDCATLIGATFGFAAAILWIGQVLENLSSKILWWCMPLGVGLVGWCYMQPNFGGLYTPGNSLALVCLPGGVAVCVLALYQYISVKSSRPPWLAAFGWLSLLLCSLGFSTSYGLRLTGILFPVTWDHYVYKLDAVLTPWAAVEAAKLMQGKPEVEAFTSAAYGVLVPSFFVLIGLAIRSGRVDRLNIWYLQLLPYLAAWTAYACVPLSGPLYAFYFSGFPEGIPSVADLIMLPVQLPPVARNGMPSMHLSGALFVLVVAWALRNRLAVIASAALVGATIWATLALGEHYVIDLVVALPFAAALAAAIMCRELYLTPAAAPWLWSCAGLAAWWLVTIRFAPLWLASQPWLLRTATATSLLLAVMGFTLTVRALWRDAGANTFVRANSAGVAIPGWISGVFFFSGVTGLLYEVVFSKALAVTFGSTALATYTVLATYMGGMAIGAGLGGILAARLKVPLRVYIFCEAAIGIYAVLTPDLFSAMQAVYVTVAADVDPSSSWLTVLRVMLGAAILGIPTIMMGATLPLMFKHVKSLGVSSANAVARLYGANVMGAAVGSTVAGYIFLPAVGRNGATYLAAAASLLIALYVLERHKRGQAIQLNAATAEIASSSESAMPLASWRHMWLGLAVLTIGGAITLGLEVLYMHMLAVVAGNSAYAFALMLSAFLLGLGLGAEVGRRCLGRYSPVLIIVVAEFALCASVAITAHGWDGIPTYFAAFGLGSPLLPFSGREAIRALVCLVVMLPPALCIGIAYPAAMSMAAARLGGQSESRGVGVASALNTLGNIAGVMLTGFALLPIFGSLHVIRVFAMIAFGLGCSAAALLYCQHVAVRPKSRAVFAVTVAAAAFSASALIAYPGQWNYQDLTTGANVYFQEQGWGRHVEHAESVAGGLTSVTVGANGIHTLLTNGKFQGNNALGGEMVAQASFALAPLLHTAARENALVIGYGTGMTTNVMHAAGFRNVEMVELASDVVSLADKYFGVINEGVLRKAGVTTHITDGRNFLLTQQRQFDVIGIEITSVWFAGAANLYNREFYELVRQRLTPEGVLQQWIQLHHIYPTDLVYVIGSVRASFRFVWLYYIGGQGIIVASNSSDALNMAPALTKMKETASLSKYMAMFDDQPERLIRNVVLTPGDVDRMIAGVDPEFRVLVSTDSNLFLEYSTPKGNARSSPDAVQENIRALQALAGKNSSAAQSLSGSQ